MTTTAQQVIDRALSRHHSFRGAGLSEGAALAELNEIQRRMLLDLGSTIENYVGETSEIQTGMDDASLVALDENDVPYFTTTVQPGYAIRFDGGVPYIVADDPIIVDPFGADGDSPGLPLPDNTLRLIFISARTADSQAPVPPLKVEIVKLEVVKKAGPRTGLQAYLSANRIIPVRLAPADLWTQVTSLILGIIPTPTLEAMDDDLVIPDACVSAATAALASFFSMQSEKCDATDKRIIAAEAAKKYEEMRDSVNAMDAVTTSTVIFRRS